MGSTLITLGCSLTEGVGCYDYSLMLNTDTYKGLQPGTPEFDRFYHLNRPNFHTKGWPAQLGKMLGYDNLINLGFGGSSTSGQVKTLFERKEELNIKAWPKTTTLIWLLSEPARISFYSGGGITNYNMSNIKDDFFYKYVTEISHDNTDMFLEQIFYIKCVEEFCENNNINLLIFHSRNEFVNALKNYYDSKHLHSIHSLMFLGERKEKETRELYSRICDHPSEKGYGILANKMFEYIKTNKKEIIFNSSGDNIKINYLGDPIKYTKDLT